MPRKIREPTFTLPCTIVISKAEQLPYHFLEMKTDAKDGNRPLVVPTERVHLPTGDYSILSFEDQVAVERKSKSDLFQTIGQERERFERELYRLNNMTAGHVVVEAEWSNIFKPDPALVSQLSPKIVYRSILAWKMRYRNVHWDMMPGRRAAEIATFRWLQRFLVEHGDKTLRYGIG